MLYILVLALLPGALGNWSYGRVVGIRWGEDQWKFALRLLGLSIFGLVLYSLATLFGAPDPIYIFPNLFASITPATLPIVGVAYLGHCLAGFIVGVLAAAGVRITSKLAGTSGYPCAWDDFVRRYVPQHMVAVSLQNGEAYVGFLKTCDVAVEQKERDLVLSEPALYNEDQQDYVALPFQQLFIPANLMYSMAVVHDPEWDKRIVPVGESPFRRKEEIIEQSTKAASA